MLLLLRALLLWSLISVHVVGGAAVFRRLFPKESAWFGFIVPCLGLVLLMNFIEHLVAVPTMLWLLPITTLGSIWAIFSPKLEWKGLRLPTGIFLASFAFTLGLQGLHPDIMGLRDGIVDLGLMSSFCLGAKVPPPMAWYPELPLSHYYALGHYGMSVLTRLLDVDVGTGFNLSAALLSAFDLFIGAAAAWRISWQKFWITVLAPILMAGASTGATAYLWLTTHNFNPNTADDILSGFDYPDNHNALLKLIHDGCRHELVPPGAWSWIGSFHSTNGGLFLALFFVWSLAEALRRKATNWPWICVGALPLLTTVTSSWALPFEGLLLLGALFWSWYGKFFPRSLRFVLLGLGLAAVLLAPTLLEFLTTATYLGGQWTDPKCRVQPAEFLILWWPIYVPIAALAFVWPKLSPAVRTIMVAVPITFVGMEIYTVGNPYDWTGKLWGYIYGAGWITLLPAVYSRRAIPFRALTLILIVSSLFSFWAWASFLWRDNSWNTAAMFRLEGTGPYSSDPVRSKLLLTLSRVKGQTILTGKEDNGASPFLAAFTGNRIFVAWADFIDGHVSGTVPPMARQSGDEVENLYDGKCANPLLFLRTHDIAAVVIFPDDTVSANVVDRLKMKLAPYYEYVDCRSDSTQAEAGIFFFHPEMLQWPLQTIAPPPDSGSQAPSANSVNPGPSPAPKKP